MDRRKARGQDSVQQDRNIFLQAHIGHARNAGPGECWKRAECCGTLRRRELEVHRRLTVGCTRSCGLARAVLAESAPEDVKQSQLKRFV